MKKLDVRYRLRDRSDHLIKGAGRLDIEQLLKLLASRGPSYVQFFIVIDPYAAIQLYSYGADMVTAYVYDELTTRVLEGYMPNASVQLLLQNLFAYGFDEDEFAELSQWGGDHEWDRSPDADYLINRGLAEGLSEGAIKKKLRAKGYLR